VHAVSLRPAAPDDAGTVKTLVCAAYEPYIERVGRPPGPMLDEYEDVIASHQVTIAEADGFLAGVLVLKKTTEGLLLDNVAVAPAFQGRGIGRLLLEHAEDEARRQGGRELLLYTHEKMAENLKLYARMGYVEYARRDEKGFSRIYMKKDLSCGRAGESTRDDKAAEPD
jgi:GNAT superfamily N-acetyltransferase